jgi:hypothetical protein
MAMNSEEKERIAQRLDLAFAEFERDGKVSTVTCQSCNGVIEIEALTATAWQMKCPCGRYRGTMRGL